ncbi:MAG: hypothetical protein QY325_06290 [Flavobacteriales bacterium]|nr:MAG: hypothetical protein QY325_06290 [Flavobacteriales bacterium]
MVRRMLLLIAVAQGLHAAAQETAPAPSPWLLRGSGAISPGFMSQHPITNIYLVGKAELFTDARMSFRGELLWYVDAQQQTPLLDQNHQIAAGPFYHWVVGRLDLALGFEPGLSFTRPRQGIFAPEEVAPVRAIPNIALCSGLTFSVWEYFQFFIDARYIHGNYTGPYSAAVPLDEFVVGAGLGWQVRLKK